MLSSTVIPKVDQRALTEPQGGQHLSDSSVPSDLEDQRLFDGSVTEKKSLVEVPLDTHFLEVPIFVDMHNQSISPTSWGTRPQRATCPHCFKTEATQIRHRSRCGTCWWCWILCLAGGLCLFALCVCCQDTEHRCVHCKKVLGHRTVV